VDPAAIRLADQQLSGAGVESGADPDATARILVQVGFDNNGFSFHRGDARVLRQGKPTHHRPWLQNQCGPIRLDMQD
jgi:hypothetical protein